MNLRRAFVSVLGRRLVATHGDANGDKTSRITERVERVLTDEPLQQLRLRRASKRFEEISERDKYREKLAGDQLCAADRALRFSRALTHEALETTLWLQSHGLSTRDLRFAVFWRFIRDDGSIVIARWKAHWVPVLYWIWFGVSFLAWLYFSYRVGWSDSHAALKISLIVGSLLAIVAVEYPLLLQTLALRRAAERIRSILDHSGGVPSASGQKVVSLRRESSRS